MPAHRQHKSGKNGFSSTNVAIEWGNEVKDVITKFVTAAIQQKYNKHALALTEMRTANEHKLQKILQAFVGGAHLCEREVMLVIFFWMAAVTDFVITSFTLFPHSIAAFVLLNPFLPDFVLPVSGHTLSIPYFFFSNNMIALI